MSMMVPTEDGKKRLQWPGHVRVKGEMTAVHAGDVTGGSADVLVRVGARSAYGRWTEYTA